MKLFEAVRAGVSIIEAAEHYGLKVNRHERCCCPFHDDHNPSMKLYPETNTYYCFTCHVSGSQIDLVAQLTGQSAKDAALMLARDYSIQYEGDSWGSVSQRPKEQPKVRPEKSYEADLKHFTEVLVSYCRRLEKWLKYAPRTPNEEPCCLWLEAVRNYDQVNMLTEALLFGDPVERATIIIGLKEDLKRYEKRIRKLAS